MNPKTPRSLSLSLSFLLPWRSHSEEVSSRVPLGCSSSIVTSNIDDLPSRPLVIYRFARNCPNTMRNICFQRYTHKSIPSENIVSVISEHLQILLPLPTFEKSTSRLSSLIITIRMFLKLNLPYVYMSLALNLCLPFIDASSSIRNINIGFYTKLYPMP